MAHRPFRPARRVARLAHAVILSLAFLCGPDLAVRAESEDGAAARAATALRDPAGSYIHGLADHTLPQLVAMPAPQRTQELRRLLDTNVDLPAIARFALGRSWRMASEEERAEFVHLFRELVLRTSETGLANYRGHTLRIAESRPVADSDEVVVRSELTLKEVPPLQVNWWLRREAETFRILDVAVEGVSVRISLRDYFNAVVQEKGGTMPALLRALSELVHLPAREAR